MMKRLYTLIFAFSLLLTLHPAFQSACAQDESEVKIFIVGPDAIGVSERAVYTITLVGGPAEEGGKWRVAARLEGKNVTEASPTGSVYNETQDSNVFIVNVTAPPLDQKMMLIVDAASLLGNRSALADDKYNIWVVKPINLRATVTNPLNSTLMNVMVNFKVDGELVGSSTIEEIGPLSEGTATFSWITRSISPGRHELVIEVDMNGDGIIDETRGETLLFEDFYGPPSEPSLVLIVLIVILVVVILILLPSTIRKKKR